MTAWSRDNIPHQPCQPISTSLFNHNGTICTSPNSAFNHPTIQTSHNKQFSLPPLHLPCSPDSHFIRYSFYTVQLHPFPTSTIPNFNHSQLQPFPTSTIPNFNHSQLQPVHQGLGYGVLTSPKTIFCRSNDTKLFAHALILKEIHISLDYMIHEEVIKAIISG